MKTIATLSFACLLMQGVAAQNTSSLTFDGIDGFAEFGNDPMFELTGPLSLEAWVKASPNQNAPWGRIIDKFHYTNVEGYNLVINSPDHTARFEMARTNGTFIFITGTTVLTDDQWHHVVATFDGSTMKLYVDGALEASQNFGPVALEPSGTILTVGSNDDGNGWLPFKGKIDQVRVWNVCLTQTDVQYNMNNCLEGNEPGLLGCWDFGPGAVLYDKTGNNNDGVFSTGVSESNDVPYSCIAGIDDQSRPSLSIGPNPFSGKTVVTVPPALVGTACNWMVIDAAGQVVQQIQVSSQPVSQLIEANDLLPGLYYLRLESELMIENLPLIIE